MNKTFFNLRKVKKFFREDQLHTHQFQKFFFYLQSAFERESQKKLVDF